MGFYLYHERLEKIMVAQRNVKNELIGKPRSHLGIGTTCKVTTGMFETDHEVITQGKEVINNGMAHPGTWSNPSDLTSDCFMNFSPLIRGKLDETGNTTSSIYPWYAYPVISFTRCRRLPS